MSFGTEPFGSNPFAAEASGAGQPASGPDGPTFSLEGRQPIGINQPPSGGSDYPFVDPSADITQLVADFYLSYEDDRCGFRYPFRIDYLYGFGDQTDAAALTQENGGLILTEDRFSFLALEGYNRPVGTPDAVHNRDVIIVDDSGRTVFDSTEADEYTEVVWSNRLLVVEWRSESSVCRVVIFTAWAETDTPRLFDLHIRPEHARLDARTCSRLPDRVKSLRVGQQRFSGNIGFEAGYNIQLAGESTDRIDGGLFRNVVAMDAVPGAGLGRAPGCTEVVPLVRKINNISPDASGNFRLELDDCLRLQPNVTITPNGTFAQYGDDVTTPAEARAAQVLVDDCRPCYDCDYFVRTYRGLKRLWDRWKGIAAQAEAVRNLHKENIARWNDALACRFNNVAQLLVIGESECKLFIGGAYCNVSKCCLTPVEIRFTMTYLQAGVPASWPSSAMQIVEAYIDGGGLTGTAKYVPLVQGPVVTFTVPYADPQATITARMRLCVTCADGDSIQVVMTAHSPEPTLSPLGQPCDFDTKNLPTTVGDQWATYGVVPGAGLTLRAVTEPSTAPLDPSPLRFGCGSCGTTNSTAIA